MWPWDAAASAPGVPPASAPPPSPIDAAALISVEAANDLVTPEEVLDTEALGYVYGD